MIVINADTTRPIASGHRSTLQLIANIDALFSYDHIASQTSLTLAERIAVNNSFLIRIQFR